MQFACNIHVIRQQHRCKLHATHIRWLCCKYTTHAPAGSRLIPIPYGPLWSMNNNTKKRKQTESLCWPRRRTHSRRSPEACSWKYRNLRSCLCKYGKDQSGNGVERVLPLLNNKKGVDRWYRVSKSRQLSQRGIDYKWEICTFRSCKHPIVIDIHELYSFRLLEGLD